MNDDNFNLIDQIYFLPKEDIFSAFLNATGQDNKKEENVTETLDQIFKQENNFNILNNFIENNINSSQTVNTGNMNLFNDSFLYAKSDFLGNKRRNLSSSELSKVGTIDNLNNNDNYNINFIENNFDKFKSNKKNKKILINKKSDDFSNYSFNSDLTETKKVLFKTVKGEEEDEQDEMKKMMRLMKNRLSARKCRQKKKSYVQNMEGKVKDLKVELEKVKNCQGKEKQIEGMILNMEIKEKEIISFNSSHKKKIENSKKDYTIIQKNLINDLLKKMVKNITPIDLKIFSNKFLKLKEFENNDNIDNIILKIDENLQM